MPEVSVVMPVHNAMPWLEAAVDSILNQTFADFEFIIVDDGSTDSGSEYLANINDNRVNVISFSKNRGIVDALNAGLAVAQGIFVARMDADDISLPQRLKMQTQFMRTHEDCAVVASSIEPFTHSCRIEVAELDRFNQCYNTGLTDKEIRSRLSITNCLCHPSVMFRRDLLMRTGGYKKEYQYAEDYELFLRIARLGRLEKLSDVLIRYRIHEGQISQSKVKRQRQLDAKIKAELLCSDYCRANEKIIIWGAGTGGQLIAEELTYRGANILGFVDADANKHGQIACGLPILGDQNMINDAPVDFVIIATTPGRQQAIEWLESHGKKYGKDFLPVW